MNTHNYYIDSTKVDRDEFIQKLNTGLYDLHIEDNSEILTYNLEKYKNTLREKRSRLLDAFDKWEKAVLRNREEDDENIMEWYYRILELEEDSLDEIPDRISHYLK